MSTGQQSRTAYCTTLGAGQQMNGFFIPAIPFQRLRYMLLDNENLSPDRSQVRFRLAPADFTHRYLRSGCHMHCCSNYCDCSSIVRRVASAACCICASTACAWSSASLCSSASLAVCPESGVQPTNAIAAHSRVIEIRVIAISSENIHYCGCARLRASCIAQFQHFISCAMFALTQQEGSSDE